VRLLRRSQHRSGHIRRRLRPLAIAAAAAATALNAASAR
jgi:hypothetical protein